MKKSSVSRAPSFAAAKPALSRKALAIGKEMVKTKSGALKLLQGAGILDKNGNHTKPYQLVA